MTQGRAILHATRSLICWFHCRMRLMRSQRHQTGRQNRIPLMMSLSLKVVMNSRTDVPDYK